MLYFPNVDDLSRFGFAPPKKERPVGPLFCLVGLFNYCGGFGAGFFSRGGARSMGLARRHARTDTHPRRSRNGVIHDLPTPGAGLNAPTGKSHEPRARSYPRIRTLLTLEFRAEPVCNNSTERLGHSEGGVDPLPYSPRVCASTACKTSSGVGIFPSQRATTVPPRRSSRTGTVLVMSQRKLNGMPL